MASKLTFINNDPFIFLKHRRRFHENGFEFVFRILLATAYQMPDADKPSLSLKYIIADLLIVSDGPFLYHLVAGSQHQIITF